MPWTVSVGADSPILSSDLEAILSVLPQSMTTDLLGVSLEPELSAGPLRLAGLDGQRIAGLGRQQDEHRHLAIAFPRTDDRYAKLKYGARFVPMFLKMVFLRKKQAWPSQPSLDVWRSLQDAGWKSAHQDQTVAWADFLSQVFSLPMETPNEEEWRVALANRLVARGLESRKTGQVSRSIMDLVQSAEPDYDLPDAAYRLAGLRQSLVKRLARSAVRQILKSHVLDAYRRAQMLQAIFAEPGFEDQVSDVLPDHLIGPLRDLTQKGEAYGLTSIPLLSETLMTL